MVSISAMCGVLIHSTKLKSSTKFIRGAKSTSAELISVSTLSLGLSHTGGGGVLPYMGYIGMCRCEGYGFQAVYSGIGYINQSVWL